MTGVESFLDNLDPETKIVCVEFAEGATTPPRFKHPENAIYIFGPVDGSITQDVADRADHVVYVRIVIAHELAATVNVLLYDSPC